MNSRVLALVVVVAALGCGGPKQSALPAAAPGDSVRIISIAPGTDAPLRVGAALSFSVEVEYSLASATSGTVTLVIQQAESGRMPLANETSVIQKGKGTVTLRKDLSVPDTAALQVFTPLTPQGGTSTSVVDTRAYKVVKG